MSSFFDEASLVFIPSGYKTSKAYSVKPTSGDGDLTFTRSNDTATRVNSAGLIEKVRTNEMFPSDTTNTDWAASGVGTVTIVQLLTGQQDPNGGTTGFRFTANIGSTISDRAFYRKSLTVNANTRTWSFWVKSASGSAQTVAFHFQGGTPQTISVTNEWQRVEYTASTIAGTAFFGVEIRGTVTDLSCDLFLYGWQLELSDFGATPYIQTSTAAVSVGPVANVPRLDYLGSSCPRLLLEPQRTNSILWSEQLQNWGPTNTTVTTNVLVSPDGYQNADTIVINDSTSRVSQNLSFGAGTYTASVYAKLTSGSGTVRINLIVDGLNSSFSFTPTTEWVRYTYTVTASTGITAIQLRGASDTPTVAFWGAQIETGAYATSYIPTLGAAVTRGADACYNLAASSLIGTTEGVIFIDIQTPSTIGSNSAFSIGAGTSGEYAQLEIRTDLSINWRYRVGGTDYINANVGSFTAGSRLKIAFAYKNLDSILYLNGSSIATDTGTTATNAWDEVRFSNFAGTGNLEAKVNQALLFKTRLSNADLAALTTI